MCLKQQQKERIKRLESLYSIILFISLLSALIITAYSSIAASAYIRYHIHITHINTFFDALSVFIWIILLFLPILVTLLGLITLPPDLYQKLIKKRMQNWLNQYGKRVSAKVVYTVKQSLMGKTYYYLSLKWEDIKTGKSHFFHQRVSHKKWYPLGSSVCIQFDPDDPSFYIVDISLPLWMWGDLIHLG